jgi:ribokinase
MRVAVVGHVEHIEFVRVARLPQAGEIVHASDRWEEVGGGGAVSVVQLAKLAGAATLFTALGDDPVGRAVSPRLATFGVRVDATFRPTPQRRGITFIDDRGERTITVIGARLGVDANDALPWDALAAMDAVYFTAGTPDVVRLARRARVLVATARVLPILEEAGVVLDAVVRSAADPSEPDPTGSLLPPPRLVAATEGGRGGAYRTVDGRHGRWRAAPLPGPVVDAYGCGDSFAAGLTFALGAGLDVDDALALAARCGAACLTGRGPFEGQLTSATAVRT